MSKEALLIIPVIFPPSPLYTASWILVLISSSSILIPHPDGAAAQKDINQAILRSVQARPWNRYGCRWSRGRLLRRDSSGITLVTTIPAPAHIWDGGKPCKSCSNSALPSSHPIQQHLIDSLHFSAVENSPALLNTTLKSCRFMYKSLQGSLTQERVCWWRYNIFLLQEAQRKIPVRSNPIGV